MKPAPHDKAEGNPNPKSELAGAVTFAGGADWGFGFSAFGIRFTGLKWPWLPGE